MFSPHGTADQCAQEKPDPPHPDAGDSGVGEEEPRPSLKLADESILVTSELPHSSHVTEEISLDGRICSNSLVQALHLNS